MNVDFSEEVERQILFYYKNGKALCSVCSENIAVLKEYNIAMQYNSNHKKTHKNWSEKRKRGDLKSQQTVFRKQSNHTFSALRASYRVTHLLAKETKPSSVGEFVRKCLQHTVQEMCLENETD
jgi:hypothetical protein